MIARRVFKLNKTFLPCLVKQEEKISARIKKIKLYLERRPKPKKIPSSE
jgi:hypothetical protein